MNDPNVPIIGQPVIKAFSMTVVFVCSCGGVLMIQGAVGSGISCKCRKAYVVGAFGMDAQGNGGVSLIPRVAP